MATVYSTWSGETTFTTVDDGGGTEPPPIDPPDPGGSGETNLNNIHIYDNFTNGNVGDSLEQATGFRTGSSTKVTTQNPYPGGTNRSLITNTDAGSHGWTIWGFVWEGGGGNGFPGPLDMKRGSEWWVRCALRFNSPWTWEQIGGPNTNESKIMKGFRQYRVYKPDGEEGALNFYPTKGQGRYTCYVVGAKGVEDQYDDWPDATIPGVDTWKMYESYVRLDRYASNNGGLAEFRCWIDGVPQGVKPKNYMMGSTHYEGTYLSRFMMNTYWNGHCPQKQYNQYAHFASAYRGTTTSGQQIDHTGDMARDSTGFPYIGMKVL